MGEDTTARYDTTADSIGKREDMAPEPIDVARLVSGISGSDSKAVYAAVVESRYACRVLYDTGQRDQVKQVLDAIVASKPKWGKPSDLDDDDPRKPALIKLIEETGKLARSCEEYLVKLGTLPELLAHLDSGDLATRDWAFGEMFRRAYNGTSRADLSSIQSKLETASLPVSNWGALNTYSLAGLKAFCRQRLGHYGTEDKKPNPMKRPPDGHAPTTPPPQKAAR